MKILRQNFKFFLLGILAIIGYSCSNDYECIDGDIRTPIKLRSSLILSEHSNLQNTQIVSGQKASFIVYDPTQTNILYNNVVLTADGTGGLSSSTAMYYPINGDNVNFYAFHPQAAPGNIDFISNDHLPVSVASDQTTQINYLNSDILHAVSLNVAPTPNPVILKFKHVASKINFTIKKGQGFSLEGLTGIDLLGIYTLGDMAITTGVFNGIDSQHPALSVSAFNVPQGTSSDTQLTGAYVIILPQGKKNGDNFIKIKFGSTEYTYVLDRDITFESGKVYNFVLTMGATGIQVTSTIEDWIDGGTINGGVQV